MLYEYLWLDANQHLRSKIRNYYNELLDLKINDYLCDEKYYKQMFYNDKNIIISEIPHWNYDGSSTGQGHTDDSEVILIPVNFIKHPFISNALLVLCENIDVKSQPVKGNSRTVASLIFNEPTNKNKHVWFGLEQEFFFFDKKTKKPFGWEGQNQIKQGEYYCGVNRSSSIERDIMNELIQTSIRVGLSMSGINQEVAPSQWEYQIGPVEGIEAADQMIFAKYILYILCERCGLYATFHPKPLSGDWNGSGCHVNISTEEIRNSLHGYNEILSVMNNMADDHSNFIQNYCGNNNDMRLTGAHETSDPSIFSFGVASRSSSVRIPRDTFLNKRGYFEDRRPGSSIDYYKTISRYLKYL